MSQMEMVVRPVVGPIKKDWEVYLHTAQTVMDEDKIVIKRFESETTGLVVEKELEFDKGGVRLRMRGCTFGQMTKRAEGTIGKFLGTEQWTTLWDRAVKVYEDSLKIERYYEVVVILSKSGEGEASCAQKDVTELVENSGLWTTTGKVHKVLGLGTSEDGFSVLLKVKMAPWADREKMAAQARALGVLMIAKQSGPFGYNEEQSQRLNEQVAEFVLNGLCVKVDRTGQKVEVEEDEDGSDEGNA